LYDNEVERIARLVERGGGREDESGARKELVILQPGARLAD